MELMWKVCYVIALVELLTQRVSAAPRFETKYAVPVVRPITESDFDRGKEYLLATTSPLSVIDVVGEKRPLDVPPNRLSWQQLRLSSPVANDVLSPGQYKRLRAPWRVGVQPATVITSDRYVTSGQTTVHWRVPDLSTLVSDEIARFDHDQIRREESDPSRAIDDRVSNHVQYLLRVPWRVPLTDDGSLRVVWGVPSSDSPVDAGSSVPALYIQRVPWWMSKSLFTHFNLNKVHSESYHKTAGYEASGFIIPVSDAIISTEWQKQKTQHGAFLATLIKKKTMPYDVYIVQNKIQVPVIVKEELYVHPMKPIVEVVKEKNVTVNSATSESSTSNKTQTITNGTGSNYITSEEETVHIDHHNETTTNESDDTDEREENIQESDIVTDHHFPTVSDNQNTTAHHEYESHEFKEEGSEDLRKTYMTEYKVEEIQIEVRNVTRSNQTDNQHTKIEVSTVKPVMETMDAPRESKAVDQLPASAAITTDKHVVKNAFIQESYQILPGHMLKGKTTPDGEIIVSVSNETTIATQSQASTQHPAIEVSTVKPVVHILDTAIESKAVDQLIDSVAITTDEQEAKNAMIQENFRIVPDQMSEEKIKSDGGLTVTLINETTISTQSQASTQRPAIDVSTVKSAVHIQSKAVDQLIASASITFDEQDAKNSMIQETLKIVPDQMSEEKSFTNGGIIVTVINETTVTTQNEANTQHPAIEVLTVKPAMYILDTTVESKAVDQLITSAAITTDEQEAKNALIQESDQILPVQITKGNITTEGELTVTVINETTITTQNHASAQHPAIEVSTSKPVLQILDTTHTSRAVDQLIASAAITTDEQEAKNAMIPDTFRIVPNQMSEEKNKRVGGLAVTLMNETTITMQNQVSTPTQDSAMEVSTVKSAMHILDTTIESKAVDQLVASAAITTDKQKAKNAMIQETFKIVPNQMSEEKIKTDGLTVTLINETTTTSQSQASTQHPAIDSLTVNPAVHISDTTIESKAADELVASAAIATGAEQSIVQTHNMKSDEWTKEDRRSTYSASSSGKETLTGSVGERVEGQENSLNQSKKGKVYVVTTKVTEVQKVITDEIPNADVTKEVKHAVRKPDGSIVIITTSYRVVPALPSNDGNAFVPSAGVALNSDEISSQRDGRNNHFRTVQSNTASIRDDISKSYLTSFSPTYSGDSHMVLSSEQPFDDLSFGELHSDVQRSLSPSGVYNSASHSIQQQSRQLSTLLDRLKDATIYDRMESSTGYLSSGSANFRDIQKPINKRLGSREDLQSKNLQNSEQVLAHSAPDTNDDGTKQNAAKFEYLHDQEPVIGLQSGKDFYFQPTGSVTPKHTA